MTKTALDRIIHDAVTRGMLGSFSREADRFGEQLARQMWEDPEFRNQCLALMRGFAKEALELISHPTPPPNVEDVLARLTRIEERMGMRPLERE